MTLADALQRWLADGEDAIYECRTCGQTLETDEQTCRICGSDEIAEYDVQ